MKSPENTSLHISKHHACGLRVSFHDLAIEAVTRCLSHRSAKTYWKDADAVSITTQSSSAVVPVMHFCTSCGFPCLSPLLLTFANLRVPWAQARIKLRIKGHRENSAVGQCVCLSNLFLVFSVATTLMGSENHFDFFFKSCSQDLQACAHIHSPVEVISGCSMPSYLPNFVIYKAAARQKVMS